MKPFFARLSSLAAATALAASIALGTPTGAAAAAPQTAVTQAAQPGQGQRGERLLILALVRNTADLTEQTPADVRAALRTGQSMAEFAAANGSSGEAVVDAVVAKARERLDQAVERGRISAERAAQAIEKITTRANELVNDAGLAARLGAPRP